MSFFGKFKPGSAASNSTAASPSKKDHNAPQPTALEKHLADIVEPIRADGSDKFFGFENYGSTCYCNSIIQCLYYSAPFRENVMSYPTKDFLEDLKNKPASTERGDGSHLANGAPLSPRTTATSAPYPNPTSPARKAITAATSFPGSPPKPEDSKETPEQKKKMAIQAGPVLDMTKDNSKEYGMEESLFTSLKDIFEAVIAQKSRTGVVSPHKFLEILRRENEMFRSAMHQDAHEFLNLLLNSVVETVEQFSKDHPVTELPKTNGVIANGSLDKAISNVVKTGAARTDLDPRWVHDIFEGVLTSETRCLTCETISQRDEAFLDLSVDLSSHTSVTSCLRKFSQEEMLCERNKFHCDPCGGLQEAEKRMKIKRLPKILALHLKRFKYTEDLQRLQKLFHRVVYPFHLRLFNTTDDAEDADRLYELYAVVVHIGGGPYHGHYVSIIKTRDRGWLLFDDELVEPVDKEYVLNFFGGEPVPGAQDARQLACAYVLFYQETTLEAVLKEQELEGQPETAIPTSEPVQTKETAYKMDAHNLLGLSTTIIEEPSQNDTLAHSMTAPPVMASPPLGTERSKKELKQEEKDRKAAQKAEEKIMMQKRKEASEKRVEALRKQEEEVRLAMEASKQSALDEAKTRGEDGHTPEKSAFGRFARPGSLHLRSRPKIFGGKDKDKEKEMPPVISPPIMPLPHGAIHDESTLTALPMPPPTFSPIIEELKDGKDKKNRFSLGRKRSTQVL